MACPSLLARALPAVGLACALLIACGSAQAQSLNADELRRSIDQCPAPISTCGNPTSFDSAKPEPYPLCPLGYECVCVPSCPHCKDCAAQVCVAAPEPKCKTACDCEPGLGCFEGECLAGFAPVFCCDSEICPSGQQCQYRDGGSDRCAPDPDPMCRLRLSQSTRAVAHILELANRCDTDQDCVAIDPGTGCGGSCPAYVNRRRADTASKRIERVDRRFCATYREDGCPFATPGCQQTRPRCVEHRCEAVPVLPSPPRPRPIDTVSPILQEQLLDLAPRR